MQFLIHYKCLDKIHSDFAQTLKKNILLLYTNGNYTPHNIWTAFYMALLEDACSEWKSKFLL